MCVICYKAKNKKLPTYEDIIEMWEHNSDGAGLMWLRPEDKRIGWKKGFMTYQSLNRYIRKHHDYLESTEVAMHFRITTHGGTCRGNTHPFVVSYQADPHKLEGVDDVVLMHNGVLSLNPRSKDISDSAELALRAGCYEQPLFYLSTIDEFIEGSRVLVFDKDGAHFYGDAFKEHDGLMYSNLNHIWHGYYGLGYKFGCYGYDSPEGKSWNVPDNSKKKQEQILKEDKMLREVDEWGAEYDDLNEFGIR